MGLVFELHGQPAGPLQRHLIIVDPEEQQEAVAGSRRVGTQQGRMVLDAPSVKAEQHRPIRVKDLTEVGMSRSRRRLAEQRLVPLEAGRHISHPDDRPRALNGIAPATLTIE